MILAALGCRWEPSLPLHLNKKEFQNSFEPREYLDPLLGALRNLSFLFMPFY